MEDGINTMVETEAVEKVADEILDTSKSSGNSALKTGLTIGGCLAAGALLWEKVAKPIGRKVGKQWKKLKAKREKAKREKAAEENDVKNVNVKDDNYDID